MLVPARPVARMVRRLTALSRMFFMVFVPSFDLYVVNALKLAGAV
jgi:hypothetical protein